MKLDITSIKPLRGILLGRLVKEDEITPGGIALPDSARYIKHEVTVVSFGESEPKNPWPTGLKAGDKLVINSYGGREIEFNRQAYIFVKHEELAAVLE